MTRVDGVHIIEAPCCGARYSLPRYLSMNFSAWEYWTDGWRDYSLMPNDEGLRRCQCGQFVLLKNMVDVGAADASDLPSIGHVPGSMLPECIANATSEGMELAARLEYWRHLNHPYRERYCQHRDAEEAATKAAWEKDNPDRRTWWDKLRGRKAPVYARPLGSPFTYPEFEATEEQLQNMRRLGEILQERRQKTNSQRTLEIAELYREQGRFEEAESEIQTLTGDKQDEEVKLIARLIRERQTAPMRYRMR